MFDHLQVSGKKQNGKLMSSTPTLDTSGWRSSNKAGADSDEDNDSPIFTGKRSKTRCLIESDESSVESESDVSEYSRSGKISSPDNSDDSSQKDSEADYSESPLENRTRKKEPHSEILDESDLSIPQYTSVYQKGKGKISPQHDTESQESNESHNIADSSGSLEESPPVPVIKKKLFSRIESDDEEASVTNLKSATPPSRLQTESCLDSFISASPESVEKVSQGACIGVRETVTPVSSPEKDKALTPQEKYGHKFKIKKKSPQIKENLPNSSGSLVSIPEVQKTPQKDSTLNESVGNSSPPYCSPSPNKNDSKLIVSPSNQSLQSSFVVADLTSSEMKMKLKEKKKLLRTTNLSALPDGGSKIKNQIQELEEALSNLSVNSVEGETSIHSETSVFGTARSPVANISYVKSPPAKNKLESSIVVVDSPQTPASPTLKELERKLEKKKIRYSRADLGSLPDGGMKMRKKMQLLEQEIARRKGSLSEMYRFDVDQGKTSQVVAEVKSSGTELLGELESKKKKLEELKMVYRAANPRSLPDGGARLKARIASLEGCNDVAVKENIEMKTTQPDIITVEGPKMHYKQSKLTDYGLESTVVSASKDYNVIVQHLIWMPCMTLRWTMVLRNYGEKSLE
ncbi:uncharacterized protein DDB_G0284459-like [Macrobrachium rosenbergii]|uniref:uncharacterized protein DDB_G0284459-like n=1 Tax=Macrobrachium rosenbergii TaxID=79674 RepID=UPI0034D74605